MVTEYGMSKKLGWLRYKANDDYGAFGGAGGNSAISGETAKLIDSEVRGLIEEAEKRARKVLTDNIDQLHLLANALLEYETLSGDEAKKLLAGEPLDRGRGNAKPLPPVSGNGSAIPSVKKPKGPIGDASAQGA